MNPTGYSSFTFVDRRLDTATGEVVLEYALDDLRLREVLHFPVSGTPAQDALAAALDLLHWVAGVSYWKTACPPEIRFSGNVPDWWQAAALDRLYREGLAEFAWNNDLDPGTWSLFEAVVGGPFLDRLEEVGPPSEVGAGKPLPQPTTHNPQPAGRSPVLCPLGGGKDSLVALERLRAMGEDVTTFAIGRAPLIGEVAAATGVPHLWVRRRLAPELAELNAQGAWNGHVPVTAINLAAGVVLALLGGFDSVVFANERSADEPTLVDGGHAVNHQFAKSLAWECLMDDWVRGYIGADLNCFSLLRRERELAVCREFAALARYHQVFSSCNRHFHLDGPRIDTRWCGQCPKCHFVFLALAPFMERRRLIAMFGADLLDQPGQTAGFEALLGLDGAKPFECVGEAAESRAALAVLAGREEWGDRAVVRSLAPRLQDVIVPELETLLEPAGPHRIPQHFLNHEGTCSAQLTPRA